MSRQKTLADREQYVVKANDLIRKTRYSLTAQQQKIILFAISKIKPDGDITTKYTFDINELANACGMRIRDGGSYYDRIKEDLKVLLKRELHLLPDGKEISVSWVGDVELSEKDATVSLTFNPNMEVFLFDLKKRYTQYRLQSVLAFRGKYAIRLYEIMRSYTTQQALEDGRENEATITLDDLKRQLDTSTYDRWVDFNRFILKPAIEEINERAEDIHIDYFPMRGAHVRTIEKINFVITPARCGQQCRAYVKRKEKLDHCKL